MATTRALRATSFAASASLLGLAFVAALTTTFVTRSLDLGPTPPPIVVFAPPPPPPSPVAQPRSRPLEPSSDTQTERVRPTESADADPVATTIPVAATTYAPPAMLAPQWVRRPRDLTRFYPHRALARSIEGRVVLDCLVDVEGLLRCAVASETPSAWGFGAAAIEMAREHRMVPATREGVLIEARYRMVVPFEVE